MRRGKIGIVSRGEEEKDGRDSEEKGAKKIDG